MAFDAGIVGYGLSATLPALFGISPLLGDVLFAGVIALDIGLLYRYLRGRPRGLPSKAPTLEQSPTFGGKAGPAASPGG